MRRLAPSDRDVGIVERIGEEELRRVDSVRRGILDGDPEGELFEAGLGPMRLLPGGFSVVEIRRGRDVQRAGKYRDELAVRDVPDRRRRDEAAAPTARRG